MEKAKAYRSAADALDALCTQHDAALSDTGLMEEVRDVIDKLENEAFSAEEDDR
ncbi:hypothetical protein [Pseudosulfitobacter pseudonitzschiae]|uniref:hypothetical protein n=1 Tax=Pseudosulfitobacter pseudonitzschiae TaxID=1402135 RepID=UPI001AF48967|nr:hypothetical protein [Pseudosulfitobacter pseudonitzschiae]MBM1817162.1 hypothetical protein [Pseudosulfitobacter pseudonitzschiae]MBM1834165.1 hypothetical protein [Pseudosulfitobacter pseudonitzschiae]MBM1839030.1 hypothetical protein [Pseudosulfitobacter pseudonitzschiae]MBM1843880.1 hypothetical protein [Pseudosulfitobacter pseudonitzschiae]MBM1848725.1 hypothetical protein [Pseudosulfitobacter pseudonitzschiae]